MVDSSGMDQKQYGSANLALEPFIVEKQKRHKLTDIVIYSKNQWVGFHLGSERFHSAVADWRNVSSDFLSISNIIGYSIGLYVMEHNDELMNVVCPSVVIPLAEFILVKH